MDRNEVAKELAAKDGVVWEKLEPILVNAYLHNADLAIAEQAAPVVKEGEESPPPFTCMVCKDEGWLDGKACYECNPVGLAVMKVAEKVVPRIIGAPIETVEPTARTENETSVEVTSGMGNGTGPADPDPGSGDPGKPAQPPKPKAQRKARKGPR